MKIKIDDHSTTARLEEICRDIGAHVGAEFPRIDVRYSPVDEILKGKSVESVFHPSGLLIHDKRPVFVYIRDHTVKVLPDDLGDPSNLRKVHFSFCRTLDEMKRNNRYESRYHVTDHTDNQYYIDVREWGYKSSEHRVLLFPCRFCLAEVGYQCFSLGMSQYEKRQIEESFDAKDALDLLQQHFEAFQKHTIGLRPDTARTGYASNQGEMSARYREKKNYVCDECGGKGDRGSTDMHHKDGNKRNNSADNLQCLCKPCHSKIHPHYRPR